MKREDFNRDWLFYKDGNDDQKVTVCLPHDAMIYEDRGKDSSCGGAAGYFYGGKYIYLKKFPVPEEWKGKTVTVEFEAVYQNAEIYVNGQFAGKHVYGYTNFYISLDSFLKYGEENEIKVIADNSKCPNSRWYTGSGIYREVKLIIGNKSHINIDGVKITPVDGNTVDVEISITGEGTIKSEIIDNGSVVAIGEGVKQTIKIIDAKLWDAEHPNLYQCHVMLEKNGQIIDETTEQFGIRTLAWSKEGFFVNGVSTLLRGGCIHHDNGILGAAAFTDAEERRVRILKEAGFNAIRSSHNPISKAMLNACDRLGMYVMDESFDQWIVPKNPYDYAKDFKECWEGDLAAMVTKDYNHPSVVMYSIGNEISEAALPEGIEIGSRMCELVKSMDPVRPVTAGINIMLCMMTAQGKGIYKSGDSSDGKNGKKKKTDGASLDSVPTSTFFNIIMNRLGNIIDKMASKPAADKATINIFSKLDICGYNYAISRYEKESKLHPERVIIGSETMPPDLYRNWQLVKRLPYVIGDFMWTGWDYLGEAGIGVVKYKSLQKDPSSGLIISGGSGVIDICGKKRPEVGWNKLIWELDNKPVIAVEPVNHSGDFAGTSMWRKTDGVESWSWKGFEGRKTKVIVYTNAAQAELFVNKVSYGCKKVSECKALFKNVKYQPGEITAVAYDEVGREIERSSMRTAEGKTEIRLTPEKTQLSANGQDLCFLNIDLTGIDGITKATEDRKVTVSVEGSGSLQALGSARPNMSENFNSDTHTTYYGKALAVIRAGYTVGQIIVRVNSEGLDEAKMIINVIEI